MQDNSIGEQPPLSRRLGADLATDGRLQLNKTASTNLISKIKMHVAVVKSISMLKVPKPLFVGNKASCEF